MTFDNCLEVFIKYSEKKKRERDLQFTKREKINSTN